MMKISFVISGFARKASGGHKIIYEYANYLIQKGDEVNIYFLNTNSLSNVKIPKGIKMFISSFVAKYSKIRWFELDKKIKRYAISRINDYSIHDGDVIIACDVKTPKFVSGLDKSKGEKVYLIQGFENWLVSDRYVYETYQLKMKKIVISKWLEEIVNTYSETPSVLIPDGIDTRNFSCKINYEERENYSICFHYRKASIKGCKYAIETIFLLKTIIPKLKVKVISNEHKPKELPDWCEFYYNQSSSQVAEINNSVRVFMCTSINEGYGLPALEAMACGCAVVSTDYLGAKEYAIDGYNALLSPTKNVEEMVKNIMKIFKNENLGKELSKNGIRTGLKFSSEVSCQKFEKAIK